MKTTVLTLILSLCLFLFLAIPAQAYYSPEQGRWISRDPIAEQSEPNLYGFVRNEPLYAWDVLGQFKGEHKQLTTESFNRYVNNSGNGFWTDECRRKTLKSLIDANVGEDDGWQPGSALTKPFYDQERHFNRPGPTGGTETEEERDHQRRVWRNLYTAHIEDELGKFDAGIKPPNKPDCAGALRALGRVTHSWQDFFAHAIHDLHGFAGSPSPFVNSPSNPGHYWPSSYPGEHPRVSEPISPGTLEYDIRLEAARDYVYFRYAERLDQWLAVCYCNCKKL